MRPPYELDVENLIGYFEIQLKHRDSGTVFKFIQTSDGEHVLDRERLMWILSNVTIYTFNGNHYDLLMVMLALHGANNDLLIDANTRLIKQGARPWDLYKHYGVRVPEWVDHVDVMEVAAGVRINLKMYGCRMHAPLVQDIPQDFDAYVQPHEREAISSYCTNDLDTTGMMREGLRSRLELREAISQQYNVDVRSKSDAQIAEAVIRSRLGFTPDRRYVPHGYRFKYAPPAYVRFATPALQNVLETVKNAEFVVTDKEEALLLGDMELGLRTGVQIPKELLGLDIKIGEGSYRLGIGGLHSQEHSRAFHSQPGVQEVIDIDVQSYYPSMILAMGMYPEQLGKAFLSIYRNIYDTRISAKAEAQRLTSIAHGLGGDEGAALLAEAKRLQTESDGLKIVLNGTFGKLLSKWSIMYAPEFGIATTMTGQLLLLMLIEMMELSGIRVISANTDGIVLVVPQGKGWLAKSNVEWWERATGLTMEESHYKSIYSRDVNNYIAITTKGKVKRKGVFRESGLLENKHPDKDVCADAVVEFLLNGTPVEKTIAECNDIRRFVVCRGVTGGGSYLAGPGAEPEYLGKAVRWYYGTNKLAKIVNPKGHAVAGSEGACPVMRLPETMPQDVDREHYIAVAYKMLSDLGAQ